GYAGKTEDADFDFEKGVIELLGDDWIATTLPAGPSNAPAPLLLVGSPKAPQLYHGLRLVASPAYLATFFPPDVPAPTRTESVVRGQTVATVALPPMPWYDGATGIVHFAQHRGYVAISTALPALAGFLDTNAVPALAGHPNFVELTRRVGGAGGGYFAYVDERRAAATRWKSLADSPQTLFEDRAWIALSPTALRLAAGVENWTNPKLLPPFERVSDYFGPRVTTGRSTSNALEFVTFRPSRSSSRP
ncbi:MAG: hypothetical protein JNL97_08865, partial [Verrucomicrobiales bacterium]|nr:hypothetical protein [Verrucomicrobiales bacterium]